MSKNNVQATLSKKIAKLYSLEELSILCTEIDNDLDIENLSGATKEKKASELVAYCRRYNLMSDLITAVIEGRPKEDWSDIVKIWIYSIYNDPKEIKSIYKELEIEIADYDLDEEPSKEILISNLIHISSKNNCLTKLLNIVAIKSQQRSSSPDSALNYPNILNSKFSWAILLGIIAFAILFFFFLQDNNNILGFSLDNETGKENADAGIQATKTAPPPLETSVPIFTPEKTPVIFTPTLPTLINNATIIPTPTQLAYETATPAQTPIPTVQATFVVTYSIIYLREGPGDNYKIIGQLLRGASGVVLEKYQNRDWWYFLKSDDGSQGWVSQIVVEFVEDTAVTSIPIALTVSPSPTPIPTQTYTPTHTPTSTETPDNGGSGNNGGQTPLPPPGPPVPPP